MEVTETMELVIIFPAILFTLFLLWIIDRIGTVRTTSEEEEEV
ncbi:MAG TPA: hypothetical protein VJ183_11940 [Chloroflexia bacterium]|jgi:hypothetical protein|nr:hypothetical protein [Chloroflexia bacterium]